MCEKKTISYFLNYLFILLIFIYLLENLSNNTGAQIHTFKDSFGYLDSAKKSFFSVDFWFSSRPIGYPLIIKIFHHDLRILIGFQVLFSMTSWILLTIYIYLKSTHRIIGLLGSLFIFYIATMPDISSWNYNVLTESITFSLLPIIFIAVLEYIRTSKKRYLVALLLLLTIFSTMRDANAYYMLSFIIFFTILYFYKSMSKIAFHSSSVFLLIIFLFSTYSANHSTPYPRWLYSYYNLFGQRFLTDNTILEYMQIHGMPTNDTLLAKKGFWAGTGNKEKIGFYNDPKLADFRDFVIAKGKTVYMKYLLTHPNYTFGQILEHKEEIFHTDRLVKSSYYPKGYKADNFFHYRIIKNIFIILLLFTPIIAITIISYTVRKNIYNKNTLPIIALLLPLGLLTIICYHGDAMEVSRHTLIVPILLKLTLLIISYVLVNEFFLKRTLVISYT